ncbi:MAG: DUF438 domain-containing protein [Methanosphaera sp.]|nr:DUF438 domain-containing protein [Methanosphaera sp.]
MNYDNFEEQVELLKSYIKRVSDGEDLEIVQADFKINFKHVPAKLIAKAEQRMMADGARVEDIQKLCNIHSALFHEMTDEERIKRMKEEMAAHNTVYMKDKKIDNKSDEISKKTIKLKNTSGHPLNILTIENEAIIMLLKEIKEKLKDSDSIDVIKKDIPLLNSITQHYAKKDELLLPLLMEEYNYPGPARVMWGAEDDIRSQMHNVANVEDLLGVIMLVEEMVYKEENILFPLCAENFSENDWILISNDMHLYSPCIVDTLPLWDKNNDVYDLDVDDDKIILPGGSLSLKQLRAMLNILPMEITIIDENDINQFFDETDNKVFLRPKTALNRDMHSCHPPRVMNMVDKLLKDFKEGKRDSMHVLSYVDGKQVLTNYYALKDNNGVYLGTMEAVLPIDGIVDCTGNNMTGPVEMDNIFP